ncbi:MAG: Dihydrolipoyllysine-residue acetyltransferase [Myxococcales bacterium]|nr:Dihydrolipoyllysine-residue acetyltransferase [Myxococcales bacterium]
MAQILGLPKLSPTMEEGVLVRWTKQEGDKVSPGDLIAEVETDKANMDFNVEDEGVLLKLLVKEGETVKLGAPVAIIGKAGEDVSALVQQAQGGAAKPAPTSEKPAPAAEKAAKPAGKEPPARGPETSVSAPAAKAEPREATKPEMDGGDETTKEPRGRHPTTKPPIPAGRQQPAAEPRAQPKPAPAPAAGKLLASPLAKSLAIELGIDLRTIHGSGPGGRIVERDVRDAADHPAQATSGGNGHAEPSPHDGEAEEARPTQAIAVRHARQIAPEGEDDFTDVPASNMRKRIAARLTEAKRDVPHF